MSAASSPHYPWRFFRAGGFDQVKLETGADLMRLDQLDQKLWVALACPIAGLEFDPKTAALIDTDHDGRLRAPEIIAAVQWAGGLLLNADLLVKGGDSIPLSAINQAAPAGADILVAAKHILTQLGRPDAGTIALADAVEAGQTFAHMPFNGDGVIVVASAETPAVKTIIEEIAACVGTVRELSGQEGINQAKADTFFAECAAFDVWWQMAEKDAATILPLSAETAKAAAAVQAAKVKVDDYFGRCRLAAYDARAAGALQRKEEDFAAILAKDISINASEIAGFPLTLPAAGKPLPLAGAVNPAHAAALSALRQAAVQPLLGDTLELTEAGWAVVQARLAPFMAWQANPAGAAVGKLGLARAREILAGTARQDIDALLARDKSFERQSAAIADVEKLLRFVRDLRVLCLNFVNFKTFYAGEAPALIQAGVLYLDQRACHLCLTVEDAGRHATMAGLAGAFIAYADCTRKATGEKLSIAAIFSQGDDENLMVGRNGVFYDRKGRDYDATITKIITNPISLREAFWSPYRKAVRLVEEQVTKHATAAEVEAVAAVSTGNPAKSKLDPSVIALVSVALGSLTVAFTTLLAYLEKIPAWKLPVVVLGVVLVISGPSMLLAFVKLRRRNLGPILDANGWAINSAARLNVPFGARLTETAELPPGSSLEIHDHYAEKTSVLPKVLLVVFIIAWIFAFVVDTGVLDKLGQGSTLGPWKMGPFTVSLGKTNSPVPPSTNSVSTNR